MNSNYFGDLTISFGHLKNIEATSFEREKKKVSYLYIFGVAHENLWGFGFQVPKRTLEMAGLMAEATALETAGALQGMKVSVVHDLMYLELRPHSRTPRRCGVDVILSCFSPLQQFHRSNHVLAKSRSVYGQHKDSESSSHLQPHQLQAHRDIALCPTSLTHFWKGCPNGS